MGNTQIYDHAPFRPYGNAILAVWDASRSTWDGIGKIESPTLQIQTDKQMLEEYREGQSVTALTRSGTQRCTLTFDWMESLNPRGNQRVFGDKTSTQTIFGWDVLYIDYEMEMYRNDGTGDYYERFVPYPTAQANYTRLGPVGTFTATPSAAGTGSGWSTAGNPDYYAWAVPIHDLTGEGTPDKTTLCDEGRLDVKYTFGKPWDEDTTDSAYDGAPVNITNATDIVTFTGTASTRMTAKLEPTPDYVAIFMNTTDDLSTARVVGIGSWATFIGAGIVALTYGSEDVFEHALGLSVWLVTGDYETPVNTAQDIDGTDVIWDNARGALKPGTDYTTESGFTWKVRQSYVRPPGFKQAGGPTGSAADYRKIAIINMDNQQDGPTDYVMPEGDVITIFRVDIAGIEGQINYAQNDWNGPVSISAECLVDPSQSGNFWERDVMSPALRGLVAQYYR